MICLSANSSGIGLQTSMKDRVVIINTFSCARFDQEWAIADEWDSLRNVRQVE